MAVALIMFIRKVQRQSQSMVHGPRILCSNSTKSSSKELTNLVDTFLKKMNR